MNSKIARAEKAIEESRILSKLKSYSPEVVSTIFVRLDTHKSDIDIVCTYLEQETFIRDLNKVLSSYDSYGMRSYENRVVGKFHFNEFMFEIYATEIPVKQQPAYRHYQVMKRLVAIGGSDFTEKVRKLKESGIKTEPAICRVLEISGEPFTAVLDIENWTDSEIQEHVARYI
ncbi:DUF4269 domain-containing protein [Myxosarcina sp. GI1(2024)]